MNEHQQNSSTQKSRKPKNDSLLEGHLYTVVNGNLQELPRDSEDTLRKIRLMDSAIESATGIQRELRKKMHGYKPDLTLICSALISAKTSEPDALTSVVNYLTEITRSLEERA
jgi:hypothetical protein